MDVKNIVNGAKNTFTSDSNPKRTKERVNICGNCIEKELWTPFKIIPETYEVIKGYRCKKCKCSLTLKVRSNSSCPLNKW